MTRHFRSMPRKYMKESVVSALCIFKIKGRLKASLSKAELQLSACWHFPWFSAIAVKSRPFTAAEIKISLNINSWRSGMIKQIVTDSPPWNPQLPREWAWQQERKRRFQGRDKPANVRARRHDTHPVPSGGYSSIRSLIYDVVSWLRLVQIQ